MGAEEYVSVPEFYAGKSVLITGAAGYLGKVLLEKLLYSCPKVDQVFVLLRDKKNVSADQRLKTMLELPIFSRLRQERPHDLLKVVLLKGDITVKNLNLTNEDLETVLEKVSVVFHYAAAIKFNVTLRTSVNVNLDGTRNMIELSQRIKNLPVFVHISTAFTNTDRSVVEETVYPPPAPLHEVYKFIEQEDPDIAKTKKFLNGRPNTYTFTKALAEHLVSETHGDLPAVIVRPSIVTPSKEEPIEGWVDNWFGITTYLIFISLGICRFVVNYKGHILDLIPIDYTCNLTLIAATRSQRKPEVDVYNSCSGATNSITSQRLMTLFSDAAVKDGFNLLPYPIVISTMQNWLVKLMTRMMYIVACVADLFCLLLFKKPRFTKLVHKMQILWETLEFYTSKIWIFKTEKTQALYKTLSPSDAQMFPCLAEDIDWDEYIPKYYRGVKKYLIDKNMSKS